LIGGKSFWAVGGHEIKKPKPVLNNREIFLWFAAYSPKNRLAENWLFKTRRFTGDGF